MRFSSHVKASSRPIGEHEKSKWQGGVEEAARQKELRKRDAIQKAKTEEYHRRKEAELSKHRPFIQRQEFLELKFQPYTTSQLGGFTIDVDHGGSDHGACTSVSWLFYYPAGSVHVIF
jgi:hypothetical protein